MTIPHLDLQIEYLTAIKAGKRMEWRWRYPTASWEGEWFRDKQPSWKGDIEYELREVTRQQYIPECDVPRALEVEPEEGTSYWTINPWQESGAVSVKWIGDAEDLIAMGRGMCFAAESDACAAWEAMTARRERS